jgi:hypothetical protein
MKAGAWEQTAAADSDFVDASWRLAETDYGPTLRHVFMTAPGGDFHAAVAFLARHRPAGFIRDNLDLLLPLAIQGGAEQMDVREVVESADRGAVRSALPALVDRVIHGQGDRYLEFVGLMSLLERLHETALLIRVVQAARQCADPDVREAAENHAGVITADADADADDENDNDTGTPAPVAAAGRPPTPPGDHTAWRRYVEARHRLGAARRYLMETDFAIDVSRRLSRGADLPAGARLLAFLLATLRTADHDAAGRILASTADRHRAELVRLLVTEIMDNPNHQATTFGNLLRLLDDLGYDEALAQALDLGLDAHNDEVRTTAQTFGRTAGDE